MEFISLHTSVNEESQIEKIKIKKNRSTVAKNAEGYNYQRTTGKTYTYSIL